MQEAPSYEWQERYDIEQEKGVSGMTADAKVGLLLGLVFIIIIAFLINGLPNIMENQDGEGIIPMQRTPKEMLPIEYGAAQVVNYNTSPAKVPIRETEAPERNKVIDLPDVKSDAEKAVVKKITEADNTQNTPAGNRTVIVRSGESLSSIAQRVYGQIMGNKLDVIEQVARINGLDSPDLIKQGQPLKFPDLSELFEPVKKNQPVKEAKNPDPGLFERAKNFLSTKSEPEHSTYIVKEDESLWEIASNKLGKGSRYKEILALNKSIKDENDIKAGTKIKLPAR